MFGCGAGEVGCIEGVGDSRGVWSIRGTYGCFLQPAQEKYVEVIRR